MAIWLSTHDSTEVSQLRSPVIYLAYLGMHFQSVFWVISTIAESFLKKLFLSLFCLSLLDFFSIVLVLSSLVLLLFSLYILIFLRFLILVLFSLYSPWKPHTNAHISIPTEFHSWISDPLNHRIANITAYLSCTQCAHHFFLKIISSFWISYFG